MHYSPAGNRDVLSIVVHKNIRLLNVIVSDILDSDHLPILFHILDHVRTTKLSEPLEKYINWEWIQSLASDLIYPRMEVYSTVEANKVARDFLASVASAYSLSTSRVTLSDLNNYLPEIERLLNFKNRLRKLRYEIKDPECRTAVNRVSKAIRRLTRKRALERWKTRLESTEATPQAIWPIARSLLKGMGQGHQLHSWYLGLKFHATGKTNPIADCLENQTTARDMYHENHERWVEARVQALLESANNEPPEKIRPCGLLKLICPES
jgi:hypothetical protein